MEPPDCNPRRKQANTKLSQLKLPDGQAAAPSAINVAGLKGGVKAAAVKQEKEVRGGTGHSAAPACGRAVLVGRARGSCEGLTRARAHAWRGAVA